MGRTPNTPWYFITTNKDIGIFSILNLLGVHTFSVYKYMIVQNCLKSRELKTHAKSVFLCLQQNTHLDFQWGVGEFKNDVCLTQSLEVFINYAIHKFTIIFACIIWSFWAVAFFAQ